MIPTAVLHLRPFYLADAFLEAGADPAVQSRIAHLAIQLRKQHRRQKGVDIRPELSLDLCSLETRDRESFLGTFLEMAQYELDAAANWSLMRAAFRRMPRMDQSEYRRGGVGDIVTIRFHPHTLSCVGCRSAILAPAAIGALG